MGSPGLDLGDMQQRVEGVEDLVQLFTQSMEELDLLFGAASRIHTRFDLGAHSRERGAKVVSDFVRDIPHALDQGLVLIEKSVELFRELIELVGGVAQGDAEISLSADDTHDHRSHFRDPIHELPAGQDPPHHGEDQGDHGSARSADLDPTFQPFVLGDIVAHRELATTWKASYGNPDMTTDSDSQGWSVIDLEGLEFTSVQYLFRPVVPGSLDDGLLGLGQQVDTSERIRCEDAPTNFHGESLGTFPERSSHEFNDLSLEFFVELIFGPVGRPVHDSAQDSGGHSETECEARKPESVADAVGVLSRFHGARTLRHVRCVEGGGRTLCRSSV